jgi:hypothetical protein
VIPAPRPAAVQPSSPRGLWLLVVLLAFWGAQLHGFAHGVSHLGRVVAAPHLALCGDCIAFANAGAAPTPAGTVAALAATPSPPQAVAVLTSSPAATTAAYRSRAPPTAT